MVGEVEDDAKMNGENRIKLRIHDKDAAATQNCAMARVCGG